MHPLPVVRGHLPARFLATALGTAPPRSPAPPACLALCAHARTQERQCATPPTFCLRAVLSTWGAPYPLPIYAPHPAHTPSTPLRVWQGRSTDSVPPSPPFCLRTIPSAFTRPTPPTRPPPLCTCGGGAARTVHLPLFLGGGDCPPSFRDQSLPPALPFVHMPGVQEAQCAHLPAHGSPHRSGYAIPAPRFYVPHPTQPACPPPLHAHAEGWGAPPPPSSPAQPALVPAPPCSRLT